jgi:hypothetical protein
LPRGRAGGAVVCSSSVVALAALAALAPAPARAQAEPAGLPPVGQSGLRIVAGQSAVIGGNAAGARERALDEAFRLAIDQALAEMLDAPTRAAQAKAIKAVEARSRSYVRRYRALDEGEANGIYTVRLEVEVDEAALRRAAERWGQGAPGPAAAAHPPGLLIVSSGAPEAPPLVLAALVALGARALAADPAVTDTPAAVQAASGAKLPQVAFVGAQAQAEGPVRGTTKIAMSCRLNARVFAVPSGLPVAEHAAAPRAFADDEETARRQCLTRAAGDLAARLAPGAGALSPGGAELRAVTVDADVVEPAAVVALLKSVRSVGAVSSAELRRVVPGRVEIRARTRAAAAALAPALSRDAALAISNVEVTGDIIRLRARLRPPASAPAPAASP